MRKLIGLFVAILLIGCGDGVTPKIGADRYLSGRRWILQEVTVGTGPSVQLNQAAYLVFEPDRQITSNFLSNCYSYRVRKGGEILAINNCIDCACPSGGCASGLLCNESIWTYHYLPGKGLLLTISGWFTGVYTAE